MLITYIRHAEKCDDDSIDPHIKPLDCILEVPYNAIISSPYVRCRETAIALNRTNVPIYVNVNLSDFQHSPHSNAKLDSTTLQWGPIPLNETLEQFSHRIDLFHDYVKDFTKVYGDTLSSPMQLLLDILVRKLLELLYFHPMKQFRISADFLRYIRVDNVS